MLPSASRQNKETLKVFKDSGSFGAFFRMRRRARAREVVGAFPLDAFGDGNGLFQRQVKTSLGNTLRFFRRMILDKGHKADRRRRRTRSTVESVHHRGALGHADGREQRAGGHQGRGVEARGHDQAGPAHQQQGKHAWKDTMLANIKKARGVGGGGAEIRGEHRQSHPPDLLVQVERTGKDQRGGNFIHAEDVRIPGEGVRHFSG